MRITYAAYSLLLVFTAQDQFIC